MKNFIPLTLIFCATYLTSWTQYTLPTDHTLGVLSPTLHHDCSLSIKGIAADRDDEYDKDLLHTGMGISIYKPNMGDVVRVREPWVGFSLFYQFLEFQAHYGHANLIHANIDNELGDEAWYVSPDEQFYGKHWSLNANVPLNFLTIGRQKSAIGTFRGNFVFSAGFGRQMVYQLDNEGEKDALEYNFMELSPGYRLRLPFCSAEFKLHASVGMTGGTYWDYKSIFSTSVAPMLTLRYDGLMHVLRPGAYNVGATAVQSEYLGGHTTKETFDTITRYTTTSRYSVSSSRVGVTFQDIGPFLGIGVKRSFQKNFVEEFTNPASMWGGVVNVRVSAISVNFTVEGGRIGHATNFTGDPDKFRIKDIDHTMNEGSGSAKIRATYLDVGFELNTLLMSLAGIFVDDRGSHTPFFAITGGYSFGFASISDQKFNDPEFAETYFGPLDPDNQTHFHDPRLSESGGLRGWYYAIDIGAVQFKYQGLKFKKAALMSNHIMSISMRLPLTRD